jgi:hypothetical protein
LPLDVPAGSWWRVASGLPLMRWRDRDRDARLRSRSAPCCSRGATWYYTGVFGVFHGTQREFLAVWKPGMAWPEACAPWSAA